MNDDSEYLLTSDELRQVQSIINGTAPGRYTLKQFFGKERWDLLGGDGDKRDYGTRFHNSYLNGQINNATANGRKSNSHAYEINHK